MSNGQTGAGGTQTGAGGVQTGPEPAVGARPARLFQGPLSKQLLGPSREHAVGPLDKRIEGIDS